MNLSSTKKLDYKKRRIDLATERFFPKAKLLLGDRLDFSNSIYKGSKEDIEVRCTICNLVYTTTPASILQGCGCEPCGRKNAGIKMANGLLEFIKKAEKKHGVGRYDYSQVIYTNNKSKVTIACFLHRTFLQTPDAHIRGQGCPDCGHKRSNEAKMLSPDEFHKRAKQFHPNLVSYDMKSYISTKYKMKMTCLRCGHPFEQTPTDHFNCVEPCPLCAGRYLDKKIFIERANITHNNKFDYSKVDLTHAKAKVIIICPEHKEFLQIADNHLAGNGCPQCVKLSNSKGSVRIRTYLTTNKIAFEMEKKFSSLKSLTEKGSPLEFDYFLPELNCLIEFDGRQHFEPVSLFGGDIAFKTLQNNDKRKNEWANKNGYKLIRISYLDEDRIEEFLEIHLNAFFSLK